MTHKKGIHFEVSERKILLRIMDLVMVLLAIYFLNLYPKFEYIQFNESNYVALALLAVYIIIFGKTYYKEQSNSMIKHHTTYY